MAALGFLSAGRAALLATVVVGSVQGFSFGSYNLASTATSSCSRCMVSPQCAFVSRRDLMFGVSTVAALVAAPSSAGASYALYKASLDSYTERKETNYVPVATSDRETLASIQQDIAYKRPRSERAAKRPPQYCAGQMASVQPMMENRCAVIGISKADQSNTRVDAFGNMNVGAYAEMLEEEARKRKGA